MTSKGRDDTYEEHWKVSNGERSFECSAEADATWLCDTLNTQECGEPAPKITEEMVVFACGNISRRDFPIDPWHIAANLRSMLKFGYCPTCGLVPNACICPPQKNSPATPVIGSPADFLCECCGTAPVWGHGRGVWWLTCDCWQTCQGTPETVTKRWKKDKAARIKAYKSNQHTPH